MKIIVQRAPGDKQGDDIVDSVLVTDIVGRARGMREIDASASKIIERGNCPLHGYMETGKLAQLTMAGQVLRGKVTAYSFTIDISADGREFTPSTSVTIERLMA
jgi:hypothetical protein